MNGRMITGISILFLKAYIADHDDGDDDDVRMMMSDYGGDNALNRC